MVQTATSTVLCDTLFTVLRQRQASSTVLSNKVLTLRNTVHMAVERCKNKMELHVVKLWLRIERAVNSDINYSLPGKICQNRHV